MDELERVRELLPDQRPDPAARQRARVRMHDVIHPSARRRRRQRTARVAAMGLAFTAVIALFVVPVALRAIVDSGDGAAVANRPGPSPSATTERPTARELLLRAALAVPADPPRSGDFWRSRIDWRAFNGRGHSSKSVEERWMSADGRFWRGYRGDEVDPRLDRVEGIYLGEGAALSYEEVRKLPADPDRLRSFLLGRVRRAGVAAGPERVLTGDALTILTTTPAPAEVRRAMFQVLADVPGWQVKGRGKDALGRAGYVIELVSDEYRQELLIDPKNGALLSETGRSMLHGKVAKGVTRVFVVGAWTDVKPAPPRK